MVTADHHSASPPVVMLASGERLSNCSTRRLELTITSSASSTVMNVAYWLRLWRMSSMSSNFWPCSGRAMRASQNRRKGAESEGGKEAGWDRPEQVDPAAAAYEVLAARLGTREVEGEVHQEDEADEVVVEPEGLELRGREWQQQQAHDRQRQDSQDEDEDS
jgi:hypothetical protein